ncbi:collagen-like protein [Flavobacteriaceae bacterium]|nr:collagen-like protein [Flavobacteriaceae bacterium]
MKKTIQNVKILLFLCSFNCALMFAQDQRNGISYQALIINSSEVELPGANQKNTPLRNQNICLQFSLIDEMGNYEYIEHTTTTTDSNGMVNVVIGTGNAVGGSPWSAIEWSAAMKSLKVDFDVTGQCNSFQELSLQQLTAVPFALYAPGSEIPGPQGDPGEDGISAYEVWLELGNTGDEQAFIDALKGEAGEAGEDGILGADGLSAYDVWLSLGNTGDEQAFIDSLKGDQGDQGDPGEPGEDIDLDWPDGTTLGDTLTWIWDGTEWVGTITNTDNNTIIITSSAGSNAQVVCEDAEIDQISYAINIDPAGLTVSGLPNGIDYNIVGNIVYITGTIDIDVTSQTTFNYTVTVPNGTINIVAQGTIIVSPKASLEVVSGELNQNSCIGEPISPITFQIDGPSPNATVTGLPPGIEAVLSGNTLTISGTATGSIASGSIYSFLVETSSLSCENISISGALTLTDCSSCYPSVNAGIDNTICAGESYVIQNSSAANYTSLVWTTSGTGTFNDTTSPTPTYFPTNADFDSGSITLTLTADNTSCTQPQQVIDTMVLTLSDCTTIDVTLVNNMRCTLFAYNVEFGATIETNNIQEIQSAGLCYNLTGGPTTADLTVSETNTGTGWWAETPPTFEMELTGLPLDVPLFVRPYVITIANEVVYGDTIEVVANDPNLNHIFDYTETGNFQIDDFPVETTSEITFVNITNLTSLNWRSDGPMSRNIVRINFPVLLELRNFFMQNEFSIRRIYAPLLETITEFRLENTSTIEVIFSSLKYIIGEFRILNNAQLLSLDFPQLELIDLGYRSLYIQQNQLLPAIEWNQLTEIKTPESYAFNIANNASLEWIELNALDNVEAFFEIISNFSLETIELQQLVNVHRRINIHNNTSLTSLSAPQLFSVGDYLFGTSSFEINANPLLSNLDLPSIRKAYGNFVIVNNSSLDTSTAFPCELYVFYNDGFDCNPGAVNVWGNLDNNYCFQDLSLRDDSELTTTPVTAITSISAESGGIITSNSFVKMQAKGVCWSTSPNPTIADTFSENGNWNDDYDSFIYNLTPNTTYYVRAYMQDCNGVYYGNEISFTTTP